MHDSEGMTRAAAILCGAILTLSASAQSPGTHQHSFGDAEKWSHVFDDPERDAWQKPHQVIHALGLAQDAAVADFGAGTGYFSARPANILKNGLGYPGDNQPRKGNH